MRSVRNLPFHTRREAWVEVNLAHVEHNCTQIRQALGPDVAMMAVLKADAYGHGATMVVPTMEGSGVSMIGVASMDEAIQLREARVELPILILSTTPDWAMHDATDFDIQLTIFSQGHLKSLERLAKHTQTPFKVQIKVDTGMNRIGVPWQEAAEFITHCQTLPYIQVEGIYSHLAKSADADFTETQLERWESVLAAIPRKPRWVHLANTGGTVANAKTHYNMVRIGLGLFGYSEAPLPPHINLKPAMGLKARVVYLHTLLPGEGVSYGQTYINTTTSPQKIATLPLGYADGLPRKLSNQIVGLHHGQVCPQVGNITMDQCMVDVTGLNDIQEGDIITLLGPSDDQQITLTQWAQTLGTIEYELMCALRVRLPKVSVR